MTWFDGPPNRDTKQPSRKHLGIYKNIRKSLQNKKVKIPGGTSRNEMKIINTIRKQES
jgi:hypothetical protein